MQIRQAELGGERSDREGDQRDERERSERESRQRVRGDQTRRGHRLDRDHTANIRDVG